MSERGNAVATDSSGNVFVTGFYQSFPLTLYNTNGTTGGTLSNTGGNQEVFIAKYSSAGAVLWAARIAGGGGGSQGRGIATDASGNVFVTGHYSDVLTLYNSSGVSNATLPTSGATFDCFVSKYSSSGEVLWAARIAGSASDVGYAIATDSSGNAVVSGYCDAAVTVFNTGGTPGVTLLYTGGSDCFVAKYSSAGVVSWAARITGTGTSGDGGYAIATDTSDNVFVTGLYGAALTVYNQGPSGTAGTTLPFAGNDDCFIAKYSSAGAVLWAAQIAGTGGEIGRGLATDPSGNVFVTGYYTAALTLYNSSGVSNASLPLTGGADSFIAKYSSAGAVLWAARIAGTTTSQDIAYGIATDTSGNAFVTGIYSAALTLYNTNGSNGATLAITGDFECFLAKYSSTGTVSWATRIGSIYSDQGFGIATDTAGNVFVTGFYEAPLTLYNTNGSNGATLPNSDLTQDCFVAKYTSDGSVSPLVANSLNVAGGYYVNGVQLAGGSAIATYSNSGAVLLADGTSTGLRGNSNLFFSNNTSLGIQTTTPVTALDVNGGVTIRNGLRPLYSNVITGSLSSGVYTVPANAYGTHFNITTSAITGITIPTVTGATDSNAYWVFRNNTGTYLSTTFTYTTAGTSFPTNPVAIPPANSVVLMVTFPSSVLGYVLF